MNIVLNGNMNESSGKAGKGFYPNTELGIDLKLITKEPGRMAVGEYLDGAITTMRNGKPIGLHTPILLLRALAVPVL